MFLKSCNKFKVIKFQVANNQVIIIINKYIYFFLRAAKVRQKSNGLQRETKKDFLPLDLFFRAGHCIC